MSIKITYFTHGLTVDDEKNLATGWSPGRLSEIGIRQSKELGKLVDSDEFDEVFSSDLRRAVNSAELAFGNIHTISTDKRLRECNFGDMTKDEFDWSLEDYIKEPYPYGESYKGVESRVSSFLDHIKSKRKDGLIAIIGHQGPQLALDVLLNGKTWRQAISDDWRKTGSWQPGWEYELKEKTIKTG